MGRWERKQTKGRGRWSDEVRKAMSNEGGNAVSWCCQRPIQASSPRKDVGLRPNNDGLRPDIDDDNPSISN